MHSLRINLNDFVFIGIIFCIISFPLNYTLLGFLRLVDLVYIFTFCIFMFLNPKICKRTLLLILLILITILVSTLFGNLIYNRDFDVSRLVFVYKYFLIFTLPWIILTIIKTDKQIKIVLKFLLITFILLCIWSNIFTYLYQNTMIRSSFPSSNVRLADSHVFSAYLSFFFGAYIFYLKNFFKHSFLLSLLISGIYFFGILSTGSRTGIVLLGIILFYFIITIFINFLKINLKINFSTKKILNFFIICFALVLSIILISYYAFDFFETKDYLIGRAFDFDSYESRSFVGRIEKFYIAIDEISYSGGILGVGLNSKFIFYDGLFSILIAHGGLLLIILITIFYLRFIKKINLKRFNKTFLFLVILFIISNLITEYIMVTRYAFPTILILCILYGNNEKKFL